MSDITLAIDASTAQISVALLDGDHVLAACQRPSTKGESGNLLTDISRLTKEGGIALDAITRYAVGLGPGNFTGLRISASIIQALALPAQTPVIGICSAHAIADAIRRQHGDKTILIIGDARRERLWMLAYPRVATEHRPEPRVTPIAEAAALLACPELVVATPDWSRIGEALDAVVPPSAMLIRENRFPDAIDIGRLARQRHSQGDTDGDIDPIYVHPPVFIEPVFTESSTHRLATSL